MITTRLTGKYVFGYSAIHKTIIVKLKTQLLLLLKSQSQSGIYFTKEELQSPV